MKNERQSCRLQAIGGREEQYPNLQPAFFFHIHHSPLALPNVREFLNHGKYESTWKLLVRTFHVTCITHHVFFDAFSIGEQTHAQKEIRDEKNGPLEKRGRENDLARLGRNASAALIVLD